LNDLSKGRRRLGQRRSERAAEDDRVDRTEDCGAEGSPDHAEERGCARGHAELLVRHGVLHGHHEHLHDEAHADAEDEHVEGE
jgi:hypothetical protein